jgi:uncharacterized protein YdiU (UPF0061 family)
MEQPRAAFKNLVRLVSVLQPILKSEPDFHEETLKDIISNYSPVLKREYSRLLCNKLGFLESSPDLMETVVHPLLVLMHDSEMDYTNYFSLITTQDLDQQILSRETLDSWIQCSYLDRADFFKEIPESRSLSERWSDWYLAYKRATDNLGALPDRKSIMRYSNPCYVLRNHIAQDVIDRADKGDYSLLDRYLKVLQKPFEMGTESDRETFGKLVPTKYRGLKCSCSS